MSFAQVGVWGRCRNLWHFGAESMNEVLGVAMEGQYRLVLANKKPLIVARSLSAVLFAYPGLRAEAAVSMEVRHDED